MPASPPISTHRVTPEKARSISARSTNVSASRPTSGTPIPTAGTCPMLPAPASAAGFLTAAMLCASGEAGHCS